MMWFYGFKKYWIHWKNKPAIDEDIHLVNNQIKGILPDVDMLSKIANVLETDVNILLGGQITTTDQSEIVKQLAKINEQLTIKNRRYKKIMKTIAIILLIIVIFGILLVILNIGTFISISNSETTTTVETMIKEVVR